MATIRAAAAPDDDDDDDDENTNVAPPTLTSLGWVGVCVCGLLNIPPIQCQPAIINGNHNNNDGDTCMHVCVSVLQ